jgi:hypothetical protein
MFEIPYAKLRNMHHVANTQRLFLSYFTDVKFIHQ